MKNPKTLFMAAAITGALAAYPLFARAESQNPAPSPTADKQSCKGTGGHGKASCQGKDHQGKDKKNDKGGCGGKAGCGGKDKQK
jgi:Spy/CpxP family protein refolding chaperone